METSYRYKKVLLVDDEELDNFVAKTIIKSYHFAEIVAAHNNASSALAFLKKAGKSPGSYFPEVIFIGH